MKVEISACSHNSQRISLWHALAAKHRQQMLVILSFSGLQRDEQLHYALPRSEVTILEGPLPR